MGGALLISNCDFLNLAEDMPTYWKNVFTCYGAMRGLTPDCDQKDSAPHVGRKEASQAGSDMRSKRRTVNTREEWTFAEMLMTSLFYNPIFSGVWGAKVLEETGDLMNKGDMRNLWSVSSERQTEAKRLFDSYKVMASLGVTHFKHMLTGLNPGEEVRIISEQEFRCIGGASGRSSAACSLRRTPGPLTSQTYRAIIEGVPGGFHETLRRVNLYKRPIRE